MAEQLCDITPTCSEAPIFDKIEKDIKAKVPNFNRLPCSTAIEQARECSIETSCGLTALHAMLSEPEKTETSPTEGDNK